MQIYSNQDPLIYSIHNYIKYRISIGYTNTNSIYSTLQNLNKFLQSKNILSPKKVTRPIIMEWLSTKKNLKQQSIYQMFFFVNCFFKYLIRISNIKTNPCEGIKLKEYRYQPYIYTIKDIHDLLAETKNMCSRPYTFTYYVGMFYYTLIYLLYATGIRISEALYIRLKDINLKEQTIFIYKGKFSKERLLPFSFNTLSKLKKFIQLRTRMYPPTSDEEPLFCNQYHKNHSRTTVEIMFRRFTKRCGLFQKSTIPPRIHDIRHTAATHWLYKLYTENQNILHKLPLLSIYMGHSNIASTQLYLTTSLALLRKANARFESNCSYRKYINPKKCNPPQPQ